MWTKILANVLIPTKRFSFSDMVKKESTTISTELPKRSETVFLSKSRYNTIRSDTMTGSKTTATAEATCNPVNPAWERSHNPLLLSALLCWKVLSNEMSQFGVWNIIGAVYILTYIPPSVTISIHISYVPIPITIQETTTSLRWNQILMIETLLKASVIRIAGVRYSLAITTETEWIITDTRIASLIRPIRVTITSRLSVRRLPLLTKSNTTRNKKQTHAKRMVWLRALDTAINRVTVNSHNVYADT